MIVIGFLIYGPVMLIGLHAGAGAEKSGGHGGGLYRPVRLPRRFGRGERHRGLYR
jgi:hypothetical protein